MDESTEMMALLARELARARGDEWDRAGTDVFVYFDNDGNARDSLRWLSR